VSVEFESSRDDPYSDPIYREKIGKYFSHRKNYTNLNQKQQQHQHQRPQEQQTTTITNTTTTKTTTTKTTTTNTTILIDIYNTQKKVVVMTIAPNH